MKISFRLEDCGKLMSSFGRRGSHLSNLKRRVTPKSAKSSQRKGLDMAGRQGSGPMAVHQPPKLLTAASSRALLEPGRLQSCAC